MVSEPPSTRVSPGTDGSTLSTWGKYTRNVVPLPSSVDASRAPLLRLTNRNRADNPSPWLPADFAGGSVARFCLCAGDCKAPLLDTVRQTYLPAERVGCSDAKRSSISTLEARNATEPPSGTT